MNRLICSFVTLLLAFTFAFGQADGGELEKPAPEMKKLSFLAGKWEGTMKFYDDGQPYIECDAKAEIAPKFDGFYLRIDYRIDSKSGTPADEAIHWTGETTIGWNDDDSEFASVGFESSTGTPAWDAGKLEDDTRLVLICEDDTNKYYRVTWERESSARLRYTMDAWDDEKKDWTKDRECFYSPRK